MFCVIQEIQLKKPNLYGHHKKLKADSFTFTFDGIAKTEYTHSYSNERFERPIRTAYKVSIHESKRVNGVVTKKQYVVTTVDYYTLLDFWIGDCLSDKKLEAIAINLGTDIDHLWQLVNAKIDPLQERIIEEFKKTDEYKAQEKHREIISKYNEDKAKFAKDYDCDNSEYDYCYNVFGELMNKTYLDKVIANYEQKCSYQKYHYSNYSGFSGDGFDWDNFNWENFKSSSGNSSYLNNISGNYTNDEKECLKKFYKILATKFHPDSNLNVDTTQEMQFLNKLKNQWRI